MRKKIIIKIFGDFQAIKPLITDGIEAGLTHFWVDTNEVKASLLKMARITVYTTDDISEVFIQTKDDESKVIKQVKQGSIIAVRCSDWKIIPLENIIAEIQEHRGELWAFASQIEEIDLLFGTLEIGVDGVVLEGINNSLLDKISYLLTEITLPPLQELTITNIKSAGTGHRVCVDTTSLLDDNEGILVGNFSRGLFLIQAETLQTEWVAPRPFRVNCGAVHCYTLVGKKTRYLSELKAGDDILAVSTDAKARKISIGRVKIETRPLLLVSGKLSTDKNLGITEDDEISVIVQNAETIRFLGPQGSISVTGLAVGDKVYCIYYGKGGRHFGTAVDEWIDEK
ncbi:MAG: 3-dehydroquinate synthase II [Candidatus Hermodarchaeota archaeon]